MNENRSVANQPDLRPETLLVGIGNSGRSDDGLGWAFLDRVQQETTFGGRIEYRYQLQVEDAALISDVDHVIFIDSYRGDLPNGFQLTHCEPSGEFAFTSHVLPAEAVLFLCRDLYGNVPRAHALMIQGLSWDLRIGMSAEAERHLENALRFFKCHWQFGVFCEPTTKDERPASVTPAGRYASVPVSGKAVPSRPLRPRRYQG